MITVQQATAEKELETVFKIREKVFVEEQKVAREEEFDDFEEESRHYLALVDGEAAGAARWRKKGSGYKLERFAVLQEKRKKGVGLALVQAVVDDIEEEAGKDAPMMLHAQLAAVPLYEKAGFVKEGDIFEECNIQHYLMRRGIWAK